MSRTYRTENKLKDGKRNDKPPKHFKKMTSRKRKAKVKDALNKNKELPRERQTDVWDWN